MTDRPEIWVCLWQLTVIYSGADFLLRRSAIDQQMAHWAHESSQGAPQAIWPCLNPDMLHTTPQLPYNFLSNPLFALVLAPLFKPGSRVNSIQNEALNSEDHNSPNHA